MGQLDGRSEGPAERKAAEPKTNGQVGRHAEGARRPRFLVIGRIEQAHGTRGEVEIASQTDFPERYKPGLRVYLDPPLTDLSELTVQSVRSKPPNLIVKFTEVEDRTNAEAVAEREITIPVEEAPSLPPESYWVHEIVGLEVYTASGEHLGQVVEVLRTGSNDVYVVQGDREYLIPATKEVVTEIDVAHARVVVNPIPGLLE